jgi:hypothetical protein
MAMSQEWNFTASFSSSEAGVLKKNGKRSVLLGAMRHTTNTEHET